MKTPLRRIAAGFLILLMLPVFPVSAEETGVTIGGPDSGLINLLLIGQDAREDSRGRSDCIILCSLHPDSGNILFTSFLRDLYVPIPGHRDNRLNAAYALGGADLLKQTLETNFSIHIDGCIEADFSGFSKLIDTLGGVSLQLRQDEADAINEETGGSLREGLQQLDGEETLCYSRLRHLDQDGDLSRTNRQRKILAALLEQYQNADLLTVLDVTADVMPLLTTDLSTRQFLKLSVRMFPLLNNPRIHSLSVPQEGTYICQTIRGMSVLKADLNQIIQEVNSLVNSFS